MPPKVHLMQNVTRKLDRELDGQVRQELGQVFRNTTDVTAYDLIESYTHDQQRKIILAVETRTQAKPGKNQAAPPLEYNTHIVKLGLREEVAADVHGWEQATRGRPVSGRMFVPVELRELTGDKQRAAAIYLDASQWYGLLTAKEEVATLEWAVHAAVFENSVQVSSVERAIRQVFRELGRWFYHTAKVDAEATARFYRAKLQLPDSDRMAFHRWKEGELWELRRDAVCLFCGYHAPDDPKPPDYLDPYDFVLWALTPNPSPPGRGARGEGLEQRPVHAHRLLPRRPPCTQCAGRCRG